jgi:hypothetical protein
LKALLVGAAAVLAAGAAQARVNWSVDLNFGVPLAPVYYGPPVYGSYVGALPAGAVSVTVGGGRYWRYGGTWYRPIYGGWGPRWVVVAPPVVVPVAVAAEPPPPAPPPLPVAPAKPDPVIYPRNGQSAEQTEADRQACNRWATTQPAALADAEVFQRAVFACMDGRGYSMK